MRIRLRMAGILTGVLGVFFTMGLVGDAGAQQYPPDAEVIKVTTNIAVPQAQRARQAQVGQVDRKGGLPETGSTSLAPLSAAGVGLVVIGAFAVTAARRRRTAQAIQP